MDPMNGQGGFQDPQDAFLAGSFPSDNQFQTQHAFAPVADVQQQPQDQSMQDQAPPDLLQTIGIGDLGSTINPNDLLAPAAQSQMIMSQPQQIMTQGQMQQHGAQPVVYTSTQPTFINVIGQPQQQQQQQYVQVSQPQVVYQQMPAQQMTMAQAQDHNMEAQYQPETVSQPQAMMHPVVDATTASLPQEQTILSPPLPEDAMEESEPMDTAAPTQQKAAASAPAPAAKAKRTRKKKDPNAPSPVSSAYGFFFRETQVSVKTHNPNIKFGELSKIVASMWESLAEENKAVYRKMNDEDKVRFERENKEYQAKLASDPQAAAAAAEAVKPAAQARSGPPRRAAAVAATTANKQVVLVTGNHGQVSAQVAPPAAPAAMVVNAPTVSPEDVTDQACIRDGCTKFAIRNPEWEDEYCSNECAVGHCKSVFSDWVLHQTQIKV